MQKDSPIFIAAGGRSGSTWVQDVLGRANGLRTVFEPLHPGRISSAGPFAYKYIPDDREEPELKKFLDEVIWGGRGRLWANYRINRNHLWHGWPAFSSLAKAKAQMARYCKMFERYRRYRGMKVGQRPIVKFIRANLMLGWLHKNYSSPILVLLRHPGAVVESKMRLWQGGWRYDELSAYLRDRTLREDYLSGISIGDVNDMSRAEGFATVWCIETLVALDKVRSHGLAMAFYENLLKDQDKEWQRIVQQLGLAEVPAGQWLRQPSQQSSPDRKGTIFDQSTLGNWMARMSDKDRLIIEEVLNRFGITAYSMNSPMPGNGALRS
ncbi:MAG: sulfotransferase [Desulfobacterales bacterium]|nr:sulfotransferase [Desulfobacterales bacterium]